MKIEKAKKFAEEKFKEMSELEYQWNIIHARCMVKALKELSKGKNIDTEKLLALAWVHDIGKTKQSDNHAEISVRILEKEFDLDEIDKDCIKNHGSSGNPKTEEGKIFQAADGNSLFYPEILMFIFYKGAREGKNLEEIRTFVKDLYEKYSKVYSDRNYAVELLKKNFNRYYL